MKLLTRPTLCLIKKAEFEIKNLKDIIFDGKLFTFEKSKEKINRSIIGVSKVVDTRINSTILSDIFSLINKDHKQIKMKCFKNNNTIYCVEEVMICIYLTIHIQPQSAIQILVILISIQVMYLDKMKPNLF